MYIKIGGLILICFIVVVFSINGIINMARPEAINPSKNVPYYNQITALTQSSSLLSYALFKARLSSGRVSSKQLNVATYFNINPQIEKLPIEQQDTVLRLKLLEWKFEKLQEQMDVLSSDKSEPLIFEIGFWILSFFIWGASIVIGHALTLFTEKFFNKRWQFDSKDIS